LIQLPHFSTLFRFQQQLLSALRNNEEEKLSNDGAIPKWCHQGRITKRIWDLREIFISTWDFEIFFSKNPCKMKKFLMFGYPAWNLGLMESSEHRKGGLTPKTFPWIRSWTSCYKKLDFCHKIFKSKTFSTRECHPASDLLPPLKLNVIYGQLLRHNELLA
jgi:hypothetical protein